MKAAGGRSSDMEPHKPARSAPVLAGLCAAALFLVAVAGTAAHPEDDAEPLGVQRCLTDCQDKFTDCVQRCDGERRCEQRCKPIVKRCVAACRVAARDGGAKPPGKSPNAPIKKDPKAVFYSREHR